MNRTLTVSACMVMMLMVISAILVLSTGMAYAQDPLPPSDLEESWTPSENAGATYTAPGVESKYDSSSAPSEPESGYSTAPSSSHYQYPPYLPITPSIMSADFIDETGRVRTQFYDEPFYLRIQINVPGIFYLAEYFPSDSGMSPHWLMYRYNLDRAGTWTLGPFYPDAYEPVGKHTWKMWMWSEGMWAQRLASFDYRPTTMAFTNPSISTGQTVGWSTLQIVVIMVLVGALGVTTGMLISNRRRYSN